MNKVSHNIHGFRTELLCSHWLIFNFDGVIIGEWWTLKPACASVAFKRAKANYPGLRGISVGPHYDYWNDYMVCLRKVDARVEKLMVQDVIQQLVKERMQ